jgi:predicted dienelactone hydrolase
MNRLTRCAITFSAVALAALLVNCGGDGGSSPAVPITVSVAPQAITVPAGARQALTATLQNDSSQQGVTWTMSPGSGAGTLTDSTATSVTYNAPASAPANDLTVTITATSVTDPARKAAATITVPAPLVVVDPASATVAAGATQTFTATLQNDPAPKGVTWAISPASGAGTLSHATSTSVTYSAPATPPASDVTVTLSATSVTDTTKSADATITFPAARVSVTPPKATVDAGSTQLITATVQYDPASSAVVWTISPASGAGSLSDATANSVTYHAPSSAPASDQSVTVTATVVGGASSGAATLTVPAIAVAVAPASALMPIISTQSFLATVLHDPAKSGVTWTLSQGTTACAPDCGVLASFDATSAKYMAPGSVPAVAQVSLVASSMTDPAKRGSSAITISSGTVKIAPHALDFGRVRKFTSVSRTTTLGNLGSAALSISPVSITGSDAKFYSAVDGCSGTLAPAKSCDITVSFKPGTSVRPYTASMTISDSSPDSPQVVPLTGFGCGKCTTTAVNSVLAATKLAMVPAPTGSQRVGTRVMQVTDGNRVDPFLANGSKRELMLRFWYPSSVDAACSRAAYTSPEVWSYFSELAELPLPTVRTNSCLDAAVANGAHPIILFSHGLTGTFTDYTFLFEDLASRGYIVVSVDHTYEATAVAFADGRIAKSVYGSHLTRIVRLDEAALSLAESVRLGDLQFVVDELQRLNARWDGPFAAHLDIAAIATAGHSLGALTALQALESDARIRAAVLIDGATPDATFTATDKPVLILDAGREQWGDDERVLWRKLHGARLAVNLRNSEHITPSDAVWLARGAVKTGGMSPETAVAAMRNYIAAFLDAHLQGQPADRLLQGRSPEYPDAEITLQQQLR